MDTTQAGQLKDWGSLAGACRADPDLEKFLSGDLDTFEESLRTVWKALARKSELESAKQKATRELHDALYTAREQARHLRLSIQLRLGLWNGRLEVFGIKPLR